MRRYAHVIALGDGVLAAGGDVVADDVVQEILESFIQLVEPPRSWKGWTRAATTHRLADLARIRRRRAEIDKVRTYVEFAAGPSAGVLADRQLGQVLASLSDRRRSVLLDHLSGDSNHVIADRYGYASAASVATTINRIVTELRQRFPELRFDLEPQRAYGAHQRQPRHSPRPGRHHRAD